MAHHNSTPQRVLDAPVSQPVVIWPLPKPKRKGLLRRATAFESTKFGPYTSPKVRKVRRGRKARWNR
jgi:hypothetical protein